MKSRYAPLLLAFSLPLVYFLYVAGLDGYFFFDDHVNILANPYIRIDSLDIDALAGAAASGGAGLAGRPISVLSFALNYYFSGLDSYRFKQVNLLIHLTNGVCIYLLTSLLLSACQRRQASPGQLAAHRWASLCAALAWMLLPINLGSVLYVVQRMTSLAALFTLLGMLAYLHGRLRMLDSGGCGWIGVLAAFVFFTPLAFLSKENGVLLPVYLLAAELTLLGGAAHSRRDTRMLHMLFGAGVILPALALGYYTLQHPAWVLDGYRMRDFTLAERLLTEPRVLWFYIGNTFLPNLSELGLFHDDFPVSTGLLAPATTLAALAGLGLLALLAIVLRSTLPLVSFGILFFLVGHSMESSFIALELVHEHRNYLPSYGLLLAMGAGLARVASAHTGRATRILALLSFLALFGGVTYVRASHWGDPLLMKEKELEHHPDSVRANIAMAALYEAMPAFSEQESENLYRQAVAGYARAAQLDANDMLGLLGLIKLNMVRSRPVERAWFDELLKRLEHAPFPPNVGNALAVLEKCVAAQACKGNRQATGSLLVAALRNPRLQGRIRAQVLLAWGDFQARVVSDVSLAQRIALEAVAVAPQDMSVRLEAIGVLVTGGDMSVARAQIEAAQALDRKGLHQASLAQLSALAAR